MTLVRPHVALPHEISHGAPCHRATECPLIRQPSQAPSHVLLCTTAKHVHKGLLGTENFSSPRKYIFFAMKIIFLRDENFKPSGRKNFCAQKRSNISNEPTADANTPIPIPASTAQKHVNSAQPSPPKSGRLTLPPRHRCPHANASQTDMKKGAQRGNSSPDAGINKEGGHLLSRIAVQYHRRRRA